MASRIEPVRKPVPLPSQISTLAARFSGFIAERFPMAFHPACKALEDALGEQGDPGADPARIDSLRVQLRDRLRQSLEQALSLQAAGGRIEALGPVETTPGRGIRERLTQTIDEIVESADGFLSREAIAASLSSEERREMLRGMILTRAVDNRLKAFFAGGEVRFGNASFQGKGFRSLGQEAIYASALRLRRGEHHRRADGSWGGDVVAPLIRDLGAVLAMRPGRETVRMVLNAQMGKQGPPMNGKDLHVGDFEHGIVPASAPLAISTMIAAGLAMAFAHEGQGRVAVSFIGEGGSSLGEWHEAINACAVARFPAIFCLQNNQTALSTPVGAQSRARVFADKAAGYGIPGMTLDGTDPDAIAAGFTWAAERARRGEGPALIELVCMRMCGHAHHDDMLYVGRDPQISWGYPQLNENGYADPDLWQFWSQRDPILRYASLLEAQGLISSRDLEVWQQEAEAVVEEEARAVVAAAWPAPSLAGEGVVAGEAPRRFIEVLEDPDRDRSLPLPGVESGPPLDPKGKTFLEAVMLGVSDALLKDDRVFVYGEDVGGNYGNAFLLLRPLLAEFGNRIQNSILAEGAVLGMSVGAALGGLRPIAEMQFNDFVASGFNQLVNNAAKIRYRWGGSVPMVVRMPWGGLRHAGPYHSQNTEPWFYRTPGLKIVVPSTPHDARALMASAVEDPDPVLYYEHIALYRDPRIRQKLEEGPPAAIPLGRAALRREGSDLAIISWGAFVHVGMRVAARLAAEDIEAAVLDLRSLAPLDRDALHAVVRHCNRVLIIHEDSRTGGIGESLAAIVQEESFEWLDAPVRVIGALDTPVPYSPPLELEFLPNEERIERAARLLVAY
ncbi:MAG TPA: thiamine pyrophosphate-dependent enzyme [Thermoanaerobaculia bacterium]|nr:thiamine pyrophosphate-dependent enzyme [Thermoanaerobaculia bacterium]